MRTRGTRKREILPTHFVFFFNDTATTEIYTLSLHDALPICPVVDVELMTGGDEPVRHAAAHAAESDESNFHVDLPCGCYVQAKPVRARRNGVRPARSVRRRLNPRPRRPADESRRSCRTYSCARLH